jgi:hypothetical protein
MVLGNYLNSPSTTGGDHSGSPFNKSGGRLRTVYRIVIVTLEVNELKLNAGTYSRMNLSL